MAEGLTARGIAVTQVEMLPEVLPTVDGENAIGGPARFAGILGTQVVKVFDLVAA
jgi:hypothetical protein